MFDIGIQELIIIFVVALLVFGPKRLPELARTLGKGFGQLRRAMFDIKAEVEREIEEETGHIKHDLPDLKQEYPFNQPPDKGQTEGKNGPELKGPEDKPATDKETGSPQRPENSSSSKEKIVPRPSE